MKIVERVRKALTGEPAAKGEWTSDRWPAATGFLDLRMPNLLGALPDILVR